MSGKRRWPVRRNVPDFVPTEDELTALVGREAVEAWAVTQDEGEASYQERIEGHFSTRSFPPAIDYGHLVALAPGKRYLDIGCGILALPAYMEEAAGKEFIGIDPMTLSGERGFPFARAYGDLLPFRPCTFDGVMFSSSLDHTLRPARALAEARRVLRTGGVLLIQETLRRNDDRFRRWYESSRIRPTRFNRFHNWAFTEETLREVVGSAGFAVRETRLLSRSDAVLVGELDDG
jgi:SAM-dependent methyltransferase